MTFDPSKETPIALVDACKLPMLGKPRHETTLRYWANFGIRGIRLDTVRVGGTICTSEAALKRFIAALSTNPITGERREPRVRVGARRRTVGADGGVT